MSAYPYISGDGVPVAHPLFQEEGDGAVPISPLQLHFEVCDISSARQLVALWHSRLPVIDSTTTRMPPAVTYWAVCANRVYAVAIWSGPVARLLNGQGMIELRRMAIGPSAPRNTASRMLAWMIKDIKKRFPDVVKAISYQDTEVHHGTIYKASGWTAVMDTCGGDWTRPNRHRKPSQSTAIKRRWERTL